MLPRNAITCSFTSLQLRECHSEWQPCINSYFMQMNFVCTQTTIRRESILNSERLWKYTNESIFCGNKWPFAGTMNLARYFRSTSESLQDGSLENDKTIQLCPERVSFFQFTSENKLRCNWYRHIAVSIPSDCRDSFRLCLLFYLLVCFEMPMISWLAWITFRLSLERRYTHGKIASDQTRSLILKGLCALIFLSLNDGSQLCLDISTFAFVVHFDQVSLNRFYYNILTKFISKQQQPEQ